MTEHEKQKLEEQRKVFRERFLNPSPEEKTRREFISNHKGHCKWDSGKVNKHFETEILNHESNLY